GNTGPLHDGLPGGTQLANAFRPSLDGPPSSAPVAAAPGPSAPQPSSSPAPSESKPAPAPKPSSGPPEGDPSIFLIKVNEAGKNAKEQDKEAKKGSDNRMTW